MNSTRGTMFPLLTNTYFMSFRVFKLTKRSNSWCFLVVALSILTLNQSCIQINSNTNYYQNLSTQWKELFVNYEPDQPLSRSKIYKINGVQLYNHIALQDKTLVYLVDNLNPQIPTLVWLESITKAQGLDLLIVMQNYGAPHFTFNQKMFSPIFIIDNTYYTFKKPGQNTAHFTKDLLAKATLNQKSDSDYLFYFEKGQLLDSGDYDLLQRNKLTKPL